MLEPGRPGPRGALSRAPGPVHPVQHGEDRGHRALHPERNPGEPLRPQFAQAGFVDALRIRLGSHLDSGHQAELGVDGPQDRAQRGRWQQGGRPAAEEHRADREVRSMPITMLITGLLTGQHPAREPDLGDGQVRIAAERGRGGTGTEFGGGIGVEVAVAAPGGAERHVDVEAERPLAQPGPRAIGQRPRGGDRLAVGEGSRHAVTLPGKDEATAREADWRFARLD